MEIDSTQKVPLSGLLGLFSIYSFILRTILDSIIIQYVASVSNKVKTEIDCMQSNGESALYSNCILECILFMQCMLLLLRGATLSLNIG